MKKNIDGDELKVRLGFGMRTCGLIANPMETEKIH